MVARATEDLDIFIEPDAANVVMPVRKFRSVEEMNQPVWRTPGDPALSRAIAGVLDLARRTNPRQFRPGVTRFRSIEEMSQAREAALAQHVNALRSQRPQGPR